MANEFVARNGLISQNNVIVSGSVSITGSSGTLFTSNTDTLEITGSLIVTGSATFTGSVNFPSGLTGSLLGTSSYATNANLLDGLDSTVFTSTASFAAQTASFTAFSASINSFSSSILSYTSSANTRLGNIEAATSSLFNFSSSHNSATSSLFSYTSSTDAKIASIYTTTSSLNTAVGSLNNATASLNNFSSSHNTATASLNAAVSSLNSATSSIQTFTSSASTRLSALEAATASLYTATSSFSGRVGALESATSSLFNFSSSHNNATSSLYSFTSSLNAKTSSFATTGSNTFVGNQTITGSLNISGSINSSGTITAQTLVVQVITSSQNFITGSTKFGSLTSNTHQFTGSVSASGSLNINNGVLYADGTNVGVGTSSPSQLLEVVGSGAAKAIKISTSTNHATFFEASTNSGTIVTRLQSQNSSFVGTVTNHSFDIVRNNTALISLSGSYVGIGISNPSYSLDVAGTGRFSGQLEIVGNIVLNSGGTDKKIYFRTAGASPDTNWSMGTLLTPSGSTVVTAAATVIDVYNGAGYGFMVRNTSNSPLLQIEGNTGAATFSSSVSATQLTINGVNDGTAIFAKRTGGANTFALNTNADGSWTMYDYANGASYTTGITQKSGNVGIGTTSPGSNLHVAGDIASAPSGSGIHLGYSSNFYGSIHLNGVSGSVIDFSSTGVDLKGRLLYDNSNNYLDFYTNATFAMRINSSGNVGIGTATTTSKLHILYAGDDSAGFRLQGDATDNTLEFRTNNDIAHIQAYTSSAFTTGASLALNAAGGNVGIGTTTTPSLLTIKASAADGNQIYIVQNNDNRGWKFRAKNDGHFYLQSSYTGADTDAITIKYENGNVGIGTTNPTNKLVVQGGASFRGGTNVTQANYNDSGSTVDIIVDNQQPKIYSSYWSGTEKNLYLGTYSQQSLLVLTTGGNVGIDTTSVTQGKLVIAAPDESTISALAIRQSNSMTYGFDFALDQTINGRAYIYSVNNGTKNSVLEIDRQPTYPNLQLVNSGGNVGIGGTPSYHLDVKEGTDNATLRVGSWAVMENVSVSQAMFGYNAAYQTSAGTGWRYINTGYAMAIRMHDAFGTGDMMFHLAASSGSLAPMASTWDTTAIKMIIKNDGNIGIGTTSPAAILHIEGNSSSTTPLGDAASFQAIIKNANTTNGTLSGLSFGSGADNYRNFIGSERTANSGNLIFGGRPTAGGNFEERMRITSGGNVGIGTTDPSQKLDVNGSGNIRGTLNVIANEPQIYLTKTGTDAGSWRILGSTGGDTRRFRVYDDTLGKDVFNIYKDSTVAFPTTASVGIGTTSPQATLDVRGKYYSVASVADNIIEAVNSDTTNGYGLYIRGGGTTSGRYVARFKNGADSDVMWVGNNGNVGIGTTSPGTILQVSPGSSYANNPTIQIVSSFADGYDAVLSLNNTHTGGRNWSIRSTNNSQGDFSGGRLVFQDTTAGVGTAVMTLKTGGFIGIGTTDPARKLTIRGADDGTMQLRLLGDSSLNSYWEIGREAGTTGQFRFIASRTGTVITPMVIEDISGNVGIGTTSPTARLHVSGADAIIRNAYIGEVPTYGSANAQFSHISRAGTDEYSFLSDNGGVTYINAKTGANIRFRVNNVDKILMDSTGNLGIGTTSPSFQLDVSPGVASATLRVGSWAIMENVTTNQAMFGRNVAYATSIGAGWRNINTAGATAIRMYDDPGDASIAFHLHGSETAGTSLTSWDSTDIKMTIRNSGNVGIGTTGPAEKLDVNGASIIRGNLTLAGGSRYITGDGGDLFIDTENVSGRDILLQTLSGQNVGIGTTAPGTRLDVAGDINIGGSYFHKVGNSAIVTAPSDQGLVAYYGFDEGSGTNISDKTGRNNTTSTNLTYTTTAIKGTALNGFGADANNVVLPNSSDFDFGTGDFAISLWCYPNSSYTNVLETLIEMGRYTAGILIRPNSNTIEVYAQGSLITSPSYVLSIDVWHHIVVTRVSSTLSVFANGTRLVAVSDSSNIQVSDTGYIGRSAHTTGQVFHGIIDEVKFYKGRGLNYGEVRGQYLSRGETALIAPIFSNGTNVGIGTTSLSYALDVAGTIRATADIIAYSDARVKENVNTITDALTKVTSLRGVSYTRNDSEDKSEKVGVIAQEVLEVLPQVVQKDTNGNYSVAYGNIVGVLIEAIKELKAEIDILKQK